MRKQQKKRNWYRLDNAAIMIPATTKGASTRVFRIVCELKEDVNPEILQEALNRTIQEFPYLNVVLRKGLFWYYLDSTSLAPIVQEDYLSPCAPLYYPSRRNLLYRVSYFHKRINLEMYHVLADGTGAFVFFRRMLIHYLEMAHAINVQDSIEFSSLQEKTDDAFKHFYEPHKASHTIANMKRARAYKRKGEPDENFDNHVIEFRISAKAFIAVAHTYHVTAGVLSAALYIEALLKQMRTQDKKNPIVISVPVNLRQYFPSETTRNFFGTISISYDPANYDGTIESILPSVANSFKEDLTKEKLKESMNALAALEYNPILRAVPLLIKDPIIGRFASLSDKGVSGTVSNLGRISMPQETQPYIRLFAAYMSKPDSQLCICSYQDEMVFGYCDGCIDHTVMLELARLLTKHGITVELTSNDCDRKE